MHKALLLSFCLLMAACSPGVPVSGSWAVCPTPRSVTENGERYTLRKPLPQCVVSVIDTTLGQELLPFQQAECYQLDVSARGIRLTAATDTGLIRGMQTLEKALPAQLEPGEVAVLPGGRIFDYPQFPYRAFLLDCGRHFFPVETIKKVIDILSLHQINQFHWHLTEDQGWRLEIKRYPRLTEVGSYRAGSPLPEQEGHDGVPVSGFYTQDEAREIVAYAARRGVEVIPEIDLPGHMKAALAAYPELGCTGGPYEVACEYGVLDDVLCAGKDQSLSFVLDVLEEVMDIFPSRYIHLGGDECPKVRWEACPHCQARIKALGLKPDGHQTAEELLQSWLMDRVIASLEKKGRRAIIWNDVLVDWGNRVIGAPSRKAVIAAWMRPVSTEIAVREGYQTILCPIGHLYLSAADGNRLTGDAYLRRVFDLNVLPEGLSPEQQSLIVGVEACLWSERVPDEDDLLWKLLPRLAAVAELQWADPQTRNYEDFLPRLRRMEVLYTARAWRWNPAESSMLSTQ